MLKYGVSCRTVFSIVVIKNNLEMISTLLCATSCEGFLSSLGYLTLLEWSDGGFQWFLSQLAVYLETNSLLL